MRFRKERAIALLTVHGGGMLLAGQATLNLFGAPREGQDLLILGIFMSLTALFGLGSCMAYLALAEAGERTGDTKLFKIREIMAASMFVAVVMLTATMGAILIIRTPKVAGSSAPMLAPAADPSPPTPARPPG